MKGGASEFKSRARILFGAFFGIMVGVSSLYFYSLGVFIKPLATAFHWTRGQASLGALVGTAGAAVLSIPAGRLVDRFGPAKVAALSVALLGLAFLALGLFTCDLVSFLALTALLSGVAAGSSPLPYTRLVVASFDRHRGLALGIALTGTGIGAIMVPALVAPFVAAHGWRAGYFLLSGVALTSAPFLWVLLRAGRLHRTVKAPPFPLGAILGDRRFQGLALIFFLASLSILGTIVQFIPMLTDEGLTPASAGAVAALLGLSAIAGRLLVGALIDRFAALRVVAGLFFASGAGLAILALGGHHLAMLGALVLGFAVGAEADLIAFLVARFFPSSSYGQYYGALYAVFLLGGAIGPALSGYMQQVTGSYRASLIGATVLLFAAGFKALSSFRGPSAVENRKC